MKFKTREQKITEAIYNIDRSGNRGIGSGILFCVIINLLFVAIPVWFISNSIAWTCLATYVMIKISLTQMDEFYDRYEIRSYLSLLIQKDIIRDDEEEKI